MRLKSTTRTAAIAIAIALALATAACGGDGDTEGEGTDAEATGTEAATDDGTGDDAGAEDLDLITEGTLTACTDAPYEPFEFEDPDAPSGYSGFDIDLLQEIADRNDLTLSVINTGFDPLLSGSVFAADTCDMGAAATTINDERDENIDFSDVYYSAVQSLAVPPDSDITSLEDTAGQRIGVQTGTTGESYAQENAPEDAEIVSFENPGDVFLALVSGDVVAILQDQPVNAARENQSGDVVVVDTYDTGENYGLLFPEEGAEALIDLVNTTLSEIRDDGTYDEIFDTYFGG